MHLVTREQIQELDRLAIHERGLSASQLMENAGRAVFEFIHYQLRLSNDSPVAVFCGKGNNGGDGFVIARLLHQAGYPVQVYLIASPDRYTGEAKKNLDSLPCQWTVLSSDSDLVQLHETFQTSFLLIDALFGTGLDRDLTGFPAKLIQKINQSHVPVLSVDIPSGLCANSGKKMGEAVSANWTVTFHRIKRGLVVGKDRGQVGELRLVSIGIPEELDAKLDNREFWLTPDCFKDLFKTRLRNSHKNSFGHVLTIAGSYRKVGAALLSARAALRAGAGLSTLALPDCAYERIEPRWAEIMFEPQLSKGDFFDPSQVLTLSNLFSGKKAIACGPGIGSDPSLKQWFFHLIEHSSVPMVLDAEALTVLSESLPLFPEKRPPLLLTPHPGEFVRLSSESKERVQDFRLETAVDFAQKHQVYVVLKGDHSIVAMPDGRAYVNSTGNPAMATAGAGDVLTGILSGLIAQNFDLEKALLAAVWIHGCAGDWVAEEKGEYGVLAWDLAEKVPFVIRSLMAEF